MELHCSGQKKHFGVHGVFRPGLHNREAAEGLPQLFCDLVRKQQLRYYRPDYNFTVFYLLSSELNIMNLSNTQPVCLSLLETLGWPLPLQPCYTRWFPQCAGKPCFLSPPAHPGPWPAPATWWGGALHFQTSPFSKEQDDGLGHYACPESLSFLDKMITQDSHSLTTWEMESLQFWGSPGCTMSLLCAYVSHKDTRCLLKAQIPHSPCDLKHVQ